MISSPASSSLRLSSVSLLLRLASFVVFLSDSSIINGQLDSTIDLTIIIGGGDKPTSELANTNDQNPNTNNDCDIEGFSLFRYVLVTDSYGEDVSWILMNTCGSTTGGGDDDGGGGTIIDSRPGGSYGSNTLYNGEICLVSNQKYQFIIMDAFGDGLCCGYGLGSYDLYYDGDRIRKGGEFNDRESTEFGSATACDTNQPPTPSPTTPSPTPNPATAVDCQSGTTNFRLELTTDEYPGDVSWELHNDCDSSPIATGSNYNNRNTTYRENILCIDDDRNQFTFVINDSHGDGLCCRYGDGSYSIYLDNTLLHTGSSYSTSDSYTFGQPCPTPPPSPVPTPPPSPQPTPDPTQQPTPDPTEALTYHPGLLTVTCEGLLLSQGLACRQIAGTGQYVQYTTPEGGQSSILFHDQPDAGAVYASPDGDGGWYYVSNAEATPGGVGSIKFNSEGEVEDYRMIATLSTRNCGGGRTSWGTWISCEEKAGGGVWETYPDGSQHERLTVVGNPTGFFESFAQDDNWCFYVTNDSSIGELRRYCPAQSVVDDAIQSNDYSNILHTSDPPGTMHYLVLSGDSDTGTFTWTTDVEEGRRSAQQLFPFAEGIDHRNGKVYFTTKTTRRLFTLDLVAQTFERTSTLSGAFDKQPDQIKFILGDKAHDDDAILYFCEDGGADCGVHGRDNTGQFFTIIEGHLYLTETTGLAFNPDATRMYVSYQGPGHIFEFWRLDGYPFNGEYLDIIIRLPIRNNFRMHLKKMPNNMNMTTTDCE